MKIKEDPNILRTHAVYKTKWGHPFQVFLRNKINHVSDQHIDVGKYYIESKSQQMQQE